MKPKALEWLCRYLLGSRVDVAIGLDVGFMRGADADVSEAEKAVAAYGLIRCPRCQRWMDKTCRGCK